MRVYQDRGLLPPPRKQGRTGWYSDAHLARLRLIGRMLERGYTFATIGELLPAWQRGWKVDAIFAAAMDREVGNAIVRAAARLDAAHRE